VHSLRDSFDYCNLFIDSTIVFYCSVSSVYVFFVFVCFVCVFWALSEINLDRWMDGWMDYSILLDSICHISRLSAIANILLFDFNPLFVQNDIAIFLCT